MHNERLSFQPCVETLEDRNLMAAQLNATLTGGVLRIEGTSGNDTIVVRHNNGRISVDNTTINVTARGKLNSVNAAGVSRVVVKSLGGNDQITLGDGNLRSPNALLKTATIWAGAGNDSVRGSVTNDFVDGGVGNDMIWGRAGNDTLRGNVGDDKIWGDDGNDHIEGGFGVNGLYGGVGNDSIYSQTRTDDIDGGYGQDTAHLLGAAAGRSLGTLRSIEAGDAIPPGPTYVVPPPPPLVSTPPPANVSVTATFLATQERKLIDLLNAYRVANNLPALTIDSRLTTAARYQANYMARTGHYNHVNLDGRTLADRVRSANYRFAFVAENIHLYDPAVRRTFGIRREYQMSELAQYFLDGWKASPPHKVNMLATAPVHIGVAFGVDSRGRIYADMVVGKP